MMDTSRPLSKHLEELRTHLIFPFVCNFFLFLILINYANIIITELLNIVNLDLSNLTTYSPTELIRLKIYVSLIGSIVICLPIWFLGFYNFSKLGLTRNEIRGLKVCFSMGLLLFLIGSISGIYYVAPAAIDLFINNDSLVIAKLSVYETTKLIISISIFCGFLISLPLLTLFATDYKDNIKDIRKYMYILIILIIIIGTPEPTLIINICFLIVFGVIMETVLIIAGEKSAN